MNEIRSMCSRDTVTFDSRNGKKIFKFYLKPQYLKNKTKPRIEFVFPVVELKDVKGLGTFFTAPFCLVFFSSLLSCSGSHPFPSVSPLLSPVPTPLAHSDLA